MTAYRTSKDFLWINIVLVNTPLVFNVIYFHDSLKFFVSKSPEKKNRNYFGYSLRCEWSRIIFGFYQDFKPPEGRFNCKHSHLQLYLCVDIGRLTFILSHIFVEYVPHIFVFSNTKGSYGIYNRCFILFFKE